MRTRNRVTVALVALVLLLGIMMVAGNSSLVAADSCVAQFGDSSLSTTQYYISNAQIVVPVTTTCSFNSGQLYAVGNIYDTSTNNNLGSTNTILTSINGGNVFNGQLVFNILPLIQNDVLQISVSIYTNGFNGSLLTSATQTVQVFGANYSAPPAYPGNYWWYYPSYQWSPSYPSYQPNPSPPPGHHDYDHSTPPSTSPGNHENPPWHYNDPTPPTHHDNPTPPSTPPHSPHDPHH